MSSDGIFEGLADPKLRFIAKRVANTGKLAAYRAIARADDPDSPAKAASKSAIDAVVLARFRSQSVIKQRRGIEKAKAFMALPADKRVRGFGDLAKVDMNSAKSVDKMALDVPIPAAMKLVAADIKRISAKPILFGDEPNEPDNDGGFAPQTDFDNLRLRIRKVKCIDETDGTFGSEAGDDEISLGGIKVDETGDVNKLEAFRVGNSFDDNESVSFSPPRKFASFNLREGSNWPKSYYVTMVLAEVDNGGLPTYLSDLFAYAKSKVEELVSQQGTAVLGPELGKIVTAIAVAVVQALIDFFTSIWEDDIFPAITAYVNINSLNHIFGTGGRTSFEKRRSVSGHGGTYKLYYDWQVYQA